MKVVKILWEDSCNSNLNWVIKEDVEVELVNIDSFGVVVKETDEFVSIAQNYGSEPEQFSNIVTIPRGCIKEIFVIHDDNYEKQGEQKPAEKPVWYDNMDDLIADGMIDEIQKSDLPEGSKHNRIYWINKHRVRPKQEWSEEDKGILIEAVSILENYGHFILANKLKSLRPQKQWKPSEEQMRVLALSFAGVYREEDIKTLRTLYEDLKAL